MLDSVQTEAMAKKSFILRLQDVLLCNVRYGIPLICRATGIPH